MRDLQPKAGQESPLVLILSLSLPFSCGTLFLLSSWKTSLMEQKEVEWEMFPGLLFILAKVKDVKGRQPLVSLSLRTSFVTRGEKKVISFPDDLWWKEMNALSDKTKHKDLTLIHFVIMASFSAPVTQYLLIKPPLFNSLSYMTAFIETDSQKRRNESLLHSIDFF